MNRTKFIAVTLALATAALVAFPALAEDSNASKTPQPGMTNRVIGRPVFTRLASRSEQLRERIASKSTEIKDRISDAKKKLLTKWWNDISKRLSALITRQGKLATKIQERITKLSGQGVDTAAAQTALNTAQTAITAAQTALTTANGQVADIIANNTPADAFSKLRDLRKTVLTAVRSAQKALVDAAWATRTSHASPSPSASPSTTATP